jgi:hypothetical protein
MMKLVTPQITSSPMINSPIARREANAETGINLTLFTGSIRLNQDQFQKSSAQSQVASQAKFGRNTTPTDFEIQHDMVEEATMALGKKSDAEVDALLQARIKAIQSYPNGEALQKAMSRRGANRGKNVFDPYEGIPKPHPYFHYQQHWGRDPYSEEKRGDERSRQLRAAIAPYITQKLAEK